MTAGAFGGFGVSVALMMLLESKGSIGLLVLFIILGLAGMLAGAIGGALVGRKIGRRK